MAGPLIHPAGSHSALLLLGALCPRRPVSEAPASFLEASARRFPRPLPGHLPSPEHFQRHLHLSPLLRGVLRE